MDEEKKTSRKRKYYVKKSETRAWRNYVRNSSIHDDLLRSLFCALCVSFFRRGRSHFSPIERHEDAFEVEKSERWSRQSAGTMAVDWSALHSLFPARWDSRAFYRRRENCAWPPKWNEKWTTKLILFNQCIIDNVSERRKKVSIQHESFDSLLFSFPFVFIAIVDTLLLLRTHNVHSRPDYWLAHSDSSERM